LHKLETRSLRARIGFSEERLDVGRQSEAASGLRKDPRQCTGSHYVALR
jgi:hypothetical protein